MMLPSAKTSPLVANERATVEAAVRWPFRFAVPPKFSADFFLISARSNRQSCGDRSIRMSKKKAAKKNFAASHPRTYRLLMLSGSVRDFTI
jgi:hypothetical protein